MRTSPKLEVRKWISIVATLVPQSNPQCIKFSKNSITNQPCRSILPSSHHCLVWRVKCCQTSAQAINCLPHSNMLPHHPTSPPHYTPSLLHHQIPHIPSPDITTVSLSQVMGRCRQPEYMSDSSKICQGLDVNLEPGNSMEIYACPRA